VQEDCQQRVEQGEGKRPAFILRGEDLEDEDPAEDEGNARAAAGRLILACFPENS
jgi:hypothetical protein